MKRTRNQMTQMEVQLEYRKLWRYNHPVANCGMVMPITYGRLGNFLFQAATAIGYALKHGLPYTLPSTTNDAKWNPIYLQHLVRKDFNPHLPKVVIQEKGHAYQELPVPRSAGKTNVILDGYWQTEKYFKAYRKEILETFGYKWSSKPGAVSVHVRRGDYLKLPQKHPPVPREWYEMAMKRFPGAHFVFLSDDIEWCREAFGYRNDLSFSGEFLLVSKDRDLSDEEQDLVAMSRCEHHICSASTFAWWGAWLNQNPNKRVIMPKLWYQPGHGGLDTSDIVPPEWERL